MLTAVTDAYRGALAGKVVEFDGRHWEPHDIIALGKELSRWQRIVAAESASVPMFGTSRYRVASFDDG
jgi:hypothetical protein